MYGSRANWGYRPLDLQRESSLTSRAVSLLRLLRPRLSTRTPSFPTLVLTTRPSKLRVSLGKHERIQSGNGFEIKLTCHSDRYCVKVPATTAGVQAAKILNEEGIRTLGTSLFSLAQAIACSQAGMLSISPYYNGKQYIIACRGRL